jgi:hypothetical protein
LPVEVVEEPFRCHRVLPSSPIEKSGIEPVTEDGLALDILGVIRPSSSRLSRGPSGR